MEQVVAQAMERQGGSVMDFEERIARLIDPTAWAKADTCREVGWPDERYERKSRAAARRVIDGLHLKETEFMTFRGPVKGIIKGHIDQEDM